MKKGVGKARPWQIVEKAPPACNPSGIQCLHDLHVYERLRLSRLSPSPCGAAVFAQAPDRTARIDRLFQTYVDENRIGGAVVLVLRDGKPVYEKAFGWADKEASRKMTPTRFSGSRRRPKPSRAQPS